MAELKTKKNTASVAKFLDAIDDPQKREDCQALLALMKSATKSAPVMWGDSIVGFGEYHYKSKSGREGDWFLVGFSPRKQNLTIYLMAGFNPFPVLMKKLGKYTTGSSCLYIKRLSDIDSSRLKALVEKSIAYMKKAHPERA